MVFGKVFWDDLTASFCNDRWREDVPNEPKLRPICRLILTFITICLIVIAAALLFHFRTDSFRSVRYFGKELSPTIDSRRLNVRSSQNLSATSHEKLLCPCTHENRTAPSSLIKIFLLSRKSDHFDKHLITDSHDFCWKQWKAMPHGTYLYWGCPVMVKSLNVTGTQILTSTLLDQDSLVNIVVNSLHESVNSWLQSYRVLLNLNRTEWLMVEELAYAFLEMASVLKRNSSSSEEDFWNTFLSRKAPNGKTLHDVLVGRALKVELSWRAYMEQCSPVYCDEVIPNSLLSRSLSAVAQLGGLISAILFVARTGVWPALRLVGGWSVERPSSLGESHEAKKNEYIQENHPPPHTRTQDKEATIARVESGHISYLSRMLSKGLTSTFDKECSHATMADEMGLATYSGYRNLKLELPPEDFIKLHAEKNMEDIARQHAIGLATLEGKQGTCDLGHDEDTCKDSKSISSNHGDI